MGKSPLKSMYEKVPTQVKRAFSPVFVNLMVRNPEFTKTWHELNVFESSTTAVQQKMQLDKLRDTLIYAQNNVPYYKRIFKECDFAPERMTSAEEISCLPLLEKSLAVALGEDLYSNDSNLQYFETYTGGSSGQALKVLVEQQSVYRERAFACHSYVKYGFDLYKSKTAAFWGHNKQQDYYYSPLKNEIVISPFRLYRENTAQKIVEDITRFGATYLAGYPSAIFQFVQMLDREAITIPVDHIFYYAENYEPDQRDYVNAYLKCSSSSNYGHTEHAVFADVTDNSCTFNKMYGYTELVPTETPDEYRIVCTGFTNRKMPLIRYATDDVVVIDRDGNQRLQGHKQSDIHLVGQNGSKIFKGAMTLHVEELKKISSYQYFQDTPGKAELRIVENEALTEAEKQSIMSYLNRRTEGLLKVSIVAVDSIPLSTRGKHIWAQNAINENWGL